MLELQALVFSSEQQTEMSICLFASAAHLASTDLISIIMGVLLGLFFPSAAWFGWEWFFQARETDDVTSALGKANARIFCALLGVGTIGGMLYFLF